MRFQVFSRGVHRIELLLEKHYAGERKDNEGNVTGKTSWHQVWAAVKDFERRDSRDSVFVNLIHLD